MNQRKRKYPRVEATRVEHGWQRSIVWGGTRNCVIRTTLDRLFETEAEALADGTSEIERCDRELMGRTV